MLRWAHIGEKADRQGRRLDIHRLHVRLSSNTCETNAVTILPLPHAAPLAAPGRAIMRDVTSGSAPAVDVRFDPRTAFDFVFSLDDDAGSTEDLPSTDRRWLDEER